MGKLVNAQFDGAGLRVGPVVEFHHVGASGPNEGIVKLVEVGLINTRHAKHPHPERLGNKISIDFAAYFESQSVGLSF